MIIPFYEKKEIYEYNELNSMKKIFLSPLFAPTFVLCYVGGLGLIYLQQSADDIMHFTGGLMEILTYVGYFVATGIFLLSAKDFKTPEQRCDYLLFFFLLICAVLRESGVQHWIPSKDTTAFKIRFFTNPNNPLSEKLLAAFLLLLVASVVGYLLIKYFPRLMRGFFHFEPVCWTVCTLGGTGVTAKFFDRFPGNYADMVGTKMSENMIALFSFIEETSEGTLPLLAALALIQMHYLYRQKKS